MHISNDPGGTSWSGPFADLLRLQTEFQSRLGEETIRYLRRLQGALGPAAPGTVVLAEPGHELGAVGTPGGTSELSVQLENLQRVHCVVSPQLTPLVGEDGTTWFPAADPGGSFRILAPGATDSLVLRLHVPETLPPGTYRGAVMLVGFRDGALPVAVKVVARGKPAGGGTDTREIPATGTSGDTAGKGKGKGKPGEGSGTSSDTAGKGKGTGKSKSSPRPRGPRRRGE